MGPNICSARSRWPSRGNKSVKVGNRKSEMSATTVQESAAPYGKVLATPAARGEQRVILHGVSWGTYKALVDDLGNSRSCRLAFNSGELEIMSPHYKHENSHIAIGQIVLILAKESGLKCQPAGALTCEREDLLKAIEPDCCFYIQHFLDVSDCDEIRLPAQPPPDLMVEVDISNSSINKLSICSALGVPEHWRYDGKKLEIRILKDGTYNLSDRSAAFPGLQFANVLPEFIRSGRRDFLAMSDKFRAWVRQELKKRKPSRPTSKKARKTSL